MAQILGDMQIGEVLTVKNHRVYKCNLPSFGMLGNTERRTKVDSIDMHHILKNLSKGATWLFWHFIENRNPKTNVVKYLPKDVSERRKLTKAYKELHINNVLKRIRQGEYLINPTSYIPSNDQFDVVKDKWNSLP